MPPNVHSDNAPVLTHRITRVFSGNELPVKQQQCVGELAAIWEQSRLSPFTGRLSVESGLGSKRGWAPKLYPDGFGLADNVLTRGKLDAAIRKCCVQLRFKPILIGYGFCPRSDQDGNFQHFHRGSPALIPPKPKVTLSLGLHHSCCAL